MRSTFCFASPNTPKHSNDRSPTPRIQSFQALSPASAFLPGGLLQTLLQLFGSSSCRATCKRHAGTAWGPVLPEVRTPWHALYHKDVGPPPPPPFALRRTGLTSLMEPSTWPWRSWTWPPWLEGIRRRHTTAIRAASTSQSDAVSIRCDSVLVAPTPVDLAKLLAFTLRRATLSLVSCMSGMTFRGSKTKNRQLHQDELATLQPHIVRFVVKQGRTNPPFVSRIVNL